MFNYKLHLKISHFENISSDKMPKFYNELMMTNEELMTSYKIRSENYNEVQRMLSEINQILFRAQRLRGDWFP